MVDTHPVTQARQLVAYVTGAAHRAAQRGPSTVAAADPTWSARCEQAAQELTGRLEATGDAVRAFEQFWADVEDLAAAVQRRTVAASGVFSRPGATATTQDVCRALGADEGRRPLVGRWLAALVATGVLREHDGAFVAPEALDPEALARAVEQRCLSARVPDAFGALWGYVRSCVDQQEALLVGSTNPLELLFPAGSWSVVHQLYAANPVSDALNRVVARFVAAAISDRSPERPLTVLEVGAGTCATTAAVLETVGAAPLEYTITDISTHFVARAEQRFAGRPGLHFATLDINGGATPDRSPGRPYDLVIAANVLHDAADLPRTLRAIEGWLVPGGSLVAVEGTTNSAAQAVTTAFLEGFRSARRTRGRPAVARGLGARAHRRRVRRVPCGARGRPGQLGAATARHRGAGRSRGPGPSA